MISALPPIWVRNSYRTRYARFFQSFTSTRARKLISSGANAPPLVFSLNENAFSSGHGDDVRSRKNQQVIREKSMGYGCSAFLEGSLDEAKMKSMIQDNTESFHS